MQLIEKRVPNLVQEHLSADRLEALTLDTLQLTASVDLIRALGGGWESPQVAASLGRL